MCITQHNPSSKNIRHLPLKFDDGGPQGLPPLQSYSLLSMNSMANPIFRKLDARTPFGRYWSTEGRSHVEGPQQGRYQLETPKQGSSQVEIVNLFPSTNQTLFAEQSRSICFCNAAEKVKRKKILQNRDGAVKQRVPIFNVNLSAKN